MTDNVVAAEDFDRTVVLASPAERRLTRLGRLYKALNTTVEVIMRARSPAELYQSVCEASVHGGKFLCTTIFILEPGDTWMTQTAGAGPLASIGLRTSVDANIPQGRGLVGEAFRTKKPCICEDILNDERLRPWWDIARKTGVNTMATLPLIRGGQSVGVLAYYSAKLGEFDEEMIGLLSRMVANVSFALDSLEHEAQRARAEAATRRASRMYAVLSATNEAIMRTKSSVELYKQICSAAVEGGKYRGAMVLLPEVDGRWLGAAAASGERLELLRGVRISVDEDLPEGIGLAGTAFRTQKFCVSNDFLNDERTRAWHPIARDAHVNAATAVPFMQRGNVVGVLMFFSEEKDAFDAGIIRLLERLTENIAFALDNFEREAERMRSQERIEYLATHDGLTGLPNRVMFNQLLTIALQTARRYERKFAVLFVDLDRFKIINDTLGHAAGDNLLQEVTARFKQALRASDVVARLGGDEFVVLVQNVTTTEQVATVARKLLAAAIRPLMLLGQECRVTASIGIAMYPGGGDDEQTLMKNADIAMYLAKEEGKNNFQVYSPAMKSQSLERLTLETSLRRALEQNELSIHYQAKLELKTNRITGVEALLRWHSPELGSVSPAQFIPIAEETGLIMAIGRWVLRQACVQNMEWRRQGLPPTCMAVNLSARQFADENLVSDIAAALRDSGMPPHLLELEITEGMVIHNPPRAIQLLTTIKQMGVRLAIDDFGTGYSSLGQLKSFPIDTLKVDRSFIREIATNADDKAITEAIIAMGKTLSLTVVAEGVETSEQAQFLREHACDEMQGYYFSKPVSAEEFAALLRQHVGSSGK